jgi:sterol desaturase/sphingolipid hydroxylase (fatty acid hydroxylase superfamily)
MKFALSRVGYFADFATMPLAALALLIGEFARGPGFAFALAAPPGFFLWTLFEYALHRIVFHSDTTIGRAHDLHHRRPAALIGVAGGYTLLIFAALYGGAVAVLGISMGGGLMLGFVVAYVAIHYLIHHRPIGPGSFLYAAKRRHLAHHRGADGNYGVTVPWWDAMFGTRRPRRRRAPPGCCF